MQSGRTLQELAVEVARQNAAKVDYAAPSTMLELTAGTDPEDPFRLYLGSEVNLGVRDTMHAQLATALKIPRPYYDRIRGEHPDLLTNNVNTLLHATPRNRMVRTLDGDARAYLSDGYRPLDNADLLEAVLPAIADQELQIVSTNVTDSRLYIHATSPRLVEEVKVGDAVQAGFIISNSEVGQGSLRIENWLYRLVCLNGMTTGNALRKAHVSRGRGGLVEDVAEFYRDSTRVLDDAAFFAKVTDTVANVLSPDTFAQTVDEMRDASERRIPKPEQTVKVVSRSLGLTDTEGESVLAHLIEGHDLSAWGLANAVTRLAHDAADYDRAVDLERAGHRVVRMDPSAWRKVADEAEALAA